MCPNKEWLHNYQAFDKCLVLIGKKSLLIRLLVRLCVIQKLTNVRYVLELRKNLISLDVELSCLREFEGD